MLNYLKNLMKLSKEIKMLKKLFTDKKHNPKIIIFVGKLLERCCEDNEKLTVVKPIDQEFVKLNIEEYESIINDIIDYLCTIDNVQYMYANKFLTVTIDYE